MLILDICDVGAVLKVIRMVKTAILIIKIVVPILLILSLMIEYMRAIYSADNDLIAKANKSAISKVIAAILVFFVPTFVNLLSGIAGFDQTLFFKCINNANKESIAQAYVAHAQKYVDNARLVLNEASYKTALSAVNEIDDPDERERLTAELDEVKKIYEEKLKKEKEEIESVNNLSTAFWWPVGSSNTTLEDGRLFASGSPSATRITATFGGDDDVHKNLRNGGHGAIDIGASHGSYVIAAQSGTVKFPGANDRIDYPDQAIRKGSDGKYHCDGLVANRVSIDHGNGIVTNYLHLYKNTILVRAGEYVKKGQVIAKVGSSGCSTAAHLHFEVVVNGTKVDPLKYVSNKNTRP